MFRIESGSPAATIRTLHSEAIGAEPKTGAFWISIGEKRMVEDRTAYLRLETLFSFSIWQKYLC